MLGSYSWFAKIKSDVQEDKLKLYLMCKNEMHFKNFDYIKLWYDLNEVVF